MFIEIIESEVNMKYPVMSIRDNLVGFLRPIVEPNQAVAIRNFRDSFSGLPEHTREDYTLFCIGEFDDQTGEIVPCSPYVVCHATDFLKDGVSDEV